MWLMTSACNKHEINTMRLVSLQKNWSANNGFALIISPTRRFVAVMETCCIKSLIKHQPLCVHPNIFDGMGWNPLAINDRCAQIINAKIKSQKVNDHVTCTWDEVFESIFHDVETFDRNGNGIDPRWLYNELMQNLFKSNRESALCNEA